MTRIDSPLRYWLGQHAAVIVDRPLGSIHSAHNAIRYPVNQGYIPNTEAGDRQPLDAYILGIDVPISSFIGEVIAIVVRHDDAEDKLVLAPAGRRIARPEIERAIQFEERFFTNEIILAGETDT